MKKRLPIMSIRAPAGVSLARLIVAVFLLIAIARPLAGEVLGNPLAPPRTNGQILPPPPPKVGPG